MHNSDMPAMPIVTKDMPVEGSGGLTKREYFAGLAMQGLCSVERFSDLPEVQIAGLAVTQADALLAALEDRT